MRLVGRFVLLRWHFVRRQSSHRPLRPQQGLTTAQGGTTLMRVLAAITDITLIVISGTWPAPRAGSAAWRKCRRGASPTPMPASVGRFAHVHIRRVQFVERRRRGAPVPRRQSYQPRPPVVRPVHEYGSGAVRPPRHRLGPGALVRELRPACIRTTGRRHRGDGTARRRSCRRRQRHRRQWQSDCGVRQQWQPGQEASVSRGRIYAYVMPTN